MRPRCLPFKIFLFPQRNRRNGRSSDRRHSGQAETKTTHRSGGSPKTPVGSETRRTSHPGRLPHFPADSGKIPRGDEPSRPGRQGAISVGTAVSKTCGQRDYHAHRPGQGGVALYLFSDCALTWFETYSKPNIETVTATTYKRQLIGPAYQRYPRPYRPGLSGNPGPTPPTPGRSAGTARGRH